MAPGFVLIIWICLAIPFVALLMLAALGAILAHIKERKSIRNVLLAFGVPIFVGLGIFTLPFVFFLAFLFDVQAIRWKEPTSESLQGSYELTRDSRGRLIDSKGFEADTSSSITIDKNGMISFDSVPDPDLDAIEDFSGKVISGTSRYQIKNEYEYYYNVIADVSESPQSIRLISLRVTRNDELRIAVGDPDSGEYLYFEKVK